MIVIDRLQLFVGQLVQLLTPGVTYVWSREYPRRTSDAAVVTCSMVRGPTVAAGRKRILLEPTQLTWTLTTPVAERRVGLEVAGAVFFADAPAGPVDVTALRDAFLAQVQLRPRVLPGVTAAASGADAVTLSGAVGTLWSPRAFGEGAAVVSTSTALSESLTSNARVILELQACAPGAGATAQGLIGQLVGGLAGHDVLEAAMLLGIAIEGPADEPIDLSSLAGPDYESRCAVRVPMTLRSYRSVPVESVGEVSTSFTTREPTVTQPTFTVTEPPP